MPLTTSNGCVQAQGSPDSGKTFRYGNICEDNVTAYFQRQITYCEPMAGGGLDCTKFKTDQVQGCIPAHGFKDFSSGNTGAGAKMIPMGEKKGC